MSAGSGNVKIRIYKNGKKVNEYVVSNKDQSYIRSIMDVEKNKSADAIFVGSRLAWKRR